MKLKSYIAAFYAALFAILLAVSPAGSGSMTLLGVGKPAGGAPATPSYTYRNTLQSGGSGDVTDFTIDIGTASADRLVIVGAAWQNQNGITSIIVDPAGANVTLTQDAYIASGNSAAMYSGLVTSGSGPVTIRLTLVSASFFNRAIGVWTATGLSSNLKKASTTMSGQNASISITSGDFLFGALYAGGVVSLSGTTPQAPSAEHSSDAANDFADWLTTSTASYALFASIPANGAFASYR